MGKCAVWANLHRVVMNSWVFIEFQVYDLLEWYLTNLGSHPTFTPNKLNSGVFPKDEPDIVMDEALKCMAGAYVKFFHLFLESIAL